MRVCEFCGKSLIGRNKKAKFCNSACRSAHYRLKQKYTKIDISPYPVWDSPLVMEGDAVIMGDLEIPFHHAGFSAAMQTGTAIVSYSILLLK